MAKKPIINHCHGAEFDRFYLNSSIRKKRLIEKVYNKCTVMIALSDEWKEQLSMIVPSERIEVIENYSTFNEVCGQNIANRKRNQQILFLRQD